MIRRSTLQALAIAFAVGLATASAVTFIDWRFNPGGVFHGPEGVSWGAVRETWGSWFVPVTLVLWAVLTPAMIWRSSRARPRRD